MNKKTFSELDDKEKQEIYNFVLTSNGTNKSSSTSKSIHEYFSSVIFEYGKSLFCFFDDGKPVLTIGAIVKDVIYKGEVFLTAINTDDKNSEFFQFYYQQVEDFVRTFKPKIIKLGISSWKKALIPYIENLGFINPYHLYEMSYNPSGIIKLQDLSNVLLEPLNNFNKGIFLKINNDAFSTCPNGGIISEHDVDKFIADYESKQDLIGVFYFENKAVGSYELEVKDNTGIILSIGIAPEYQGRGLSRILLNSVIAKLQEYKSEKIKLNVISTNTVAYNIYLKYGFTQDSIISYWFEKSI